MVGLAILRSDKIDFFKSYNKSQRRTSYNGKEINTRRYSIRYNKYGLNTRKHII